MISICVGSRRARRAYKGAVASYPIILAPSAADRVRAGAKTQVRLIATSPLRDCRPGDRLWVKETCVGGRQAAGQAHDLFAAIYKADFVVFTDGWRQDKQGRGEHGRVPTSRKLEWAPAIRMPRWASRTELVVEAVAVEPLCSIDRAGIIADGQIAAFAGFYGRWRHPARGLWRDPKRAFAAMWNATHGTPGERWEDNPDVVVLSFRTAG